MKKILIIEDDAPLSRLLGKILKARYDVTVIGNPMEAWSWLSEGNTPDLIVCDIDKPSQDEIEFLENLRFSGLYSDIPLVILSDVQDAEQRNALAELGAFSHLLKPFEPQSLLSEIRRGLLHRNEVVFID